ncbi:MAG TPA: hypothetical protein VGP93_10280, partial [Polyangiaceae bacterium]|nr:hypothetical protein [Polyangiaceae bacterium]
MFLLKLLLWLLVGIEASYLVLGNLFLSFGGVAKMFEATNDINATFESAYTIWPGDVHVRGLRIVFQDYNLQWSLDLPEVHVKLRLRELLKRTFHASSVRGEGAIFRMRHRVEPEDAGRPYVAALAPIPEYETPAVFEARVPRPPIPDDKYNLWTVHLEDVDVAVQEIWAQQFRILGSGRARGAFRLRAARTLWVGPASLDLYSSRVVAGDHDLALQLQGRIECNVVPFNVNVPDGREVLRYISTRIQLRASGMRWAAAELFIDPAARLTLASGPGTLLADVVMERGRIAESSSLTLSSERFALLHPEFTLGLEQPTLVLRGTPNGTGESVVAFASALFQRRDPHGKPPWSGAFSMAFEETSLDTAAPAWALSEARFHAPDLHAPDLTWFNDWLQATGVRVEHGELTLALLGRFADNHWHAQAQARTLDTRLRRGERWLQAGLDLQATLDSDRTFLPAAGASFVAKLARLESGGSGSDLSLRAPSADVSGEIRGEPNGVSHGRLAVRMPELHVGSSDGSADVRTLVTRARFDRQSDGVLHGKLSAEADAIAGRLGAASLFAPGAEISGNVRSEPDGAMHGDLRGRMPELHVSGSGKSADVRALESSAIFSLESDGVLQGKLSSEAKSVAAHFGKLTLRGRPLVALEARDWDPARGAGKILTELTAHDATLGDEAESEPESCPMASSQLVTVRAEQELLGGRATRTRLSATLDKAGLTWGDFRARSNAELRAEIESGEPGEAGDRNTQIALSLVARDSVFQSGDGPTRGWQAEAPSLLLSARLSGENTLQGHVGLRVQRARGRIGKTPVSSDVNARFDVTALDLERRDARGSGQV